MERKECVCTNGGTKISDMRVFLFLYGFLYIYYFVGYEYVLDVHLKMWTKSELRRNIFIIGAVVEQWPRV